MTRMTVFTYYPCYLLKIFRENRRVLSLKHQLCKSRREQTESCALKPAVLLFPPLHSPSSTTSCLHLTSASPFSKCRRSWNVHELNFQLLMKRLLYMHNSHHLRARQKITHCKILGRGPIWAFSWCFICLQLAETTTMTQWSMYFNVMRKKNIPRLKPPLT